MGSIEDEGWRWRTGVSGVVNTGRRGCVVLEFEGRQMLARLTRKMFTEVKSLIWFNLFSRARSWFRCIPYLAGLADAWRCLSATTVVVFHVMHITIIYLSVLYL